MHSSLSGFVVPGRRKSRGFSLVELLSAIGIVGILAALSLPAIGRMQEKAQAAKCVSNLKQWGSAVMTYVAENDGSLPSNQSGLWYADLWPYAVPGTTKTFSVVAPNGVLPPVWKNTIYECPQAVRLDPKNAPLRCYGFNLRAGDLDTATPDKLASILKPASTVLVGENKTSNDLGITTITARHNNQCHAVYMDGHVGGVTVDSTLTSDYTNIFWGLTKFANQWP